MSARKILLLTGVGPLLGAFRVVGLLASYRTLGVPAKPEVLAWTMVGCCVWGLSVPFIVHWSERDPVGAAAVRPQLLRHLARAVVLSAATCVAIWLARLGGEVWLGTEPFTARQLISAFFTSWLLLDLFLYAVVLGTVSLLLYQRKLRETELAAARLETALVQTEIKLLKAELDPHFVFNALHTISALVHRDPAAADRMVCRLSDFLRLSLASTGAQEVTLQQELEHMRSYMEVQMVRFRGRLSLAVDVPTSLLGCTVPNLLLQPLIENVVKHAVAAELRPVRAEVRARREGEELVLEVEDDGPGPPAAERRREGIGLANTRGRLQKLYGDAHRLTLAERPGGGTLLRVALPLRRAAGEVALDTDELELLEDTADVARLPG